MQIYYTNNYTGAKDESHRLLERAIAAYDEEHAFSGNAGSRSLAVKNAANLVADMRTTEMGKPYIPDWNEFSISHSESSWAVLIADGSDKHIDCCGLDIQFEREVKVLKLAERWYHPDELACEFFRIWTRREALVKASGESIVNSNLPSTREDEVKFRDAVWQLRDVAIPGIDHAAICAKQISDIKLAELRTE